MDRAVQVAVDEFLNRSQIVFRDTFLFVQLRARMPFSANDLPLTPGARRALALAQHLARIGTLGKPAATGEAHSVELLPLHVLWGLLLDESQAAEQLMGRGVSAEVVQAHCPLPADVFANIRAGSGELSGHVDELRTPLSDDPTLQALLWAARQQMQMLGTVGEITSEHLLQALVAVESPASRLLADYGFTRQELGRMEQAAAGPIATAERVSLPGPPELNLTDTYRLLDAAANRAREGLRVLEDYVRFVLDDRHLTTRLKTWRHQFSEHMGRLSPALLLAARETRGDVGTTVRTRHEVHRESLLDVVRAAFKRVQEATRSVEECTKVVIPGLAEELAQLRYDLYTLEKGVLITIGSRERLAGRGLYLIASEELCHHGSGPAIRGAVAGGAGIVQVREKHMRDRELLAHARRVREWTRAADALLIMNDRPDLAVLADADGVHVGQDELPVREVRRIVGPQKLVGVSTHSIEQARQAVLDGADYIGVGPVFPSQTKAFNEFAGLALVKQVAAEITLPAYAIGGIDSNNIAAVVQAGARCVAVSGAICRAEQPDAAARSLRAFLP